MTNQTTTSIGRYGEDIAVDYLANNGYTILERNYRYNHREIDIIARTEKSLVFVEVKARTDNERNMRRYGRPGSAVTRHKQRLISEAALFYMHDKNLRMGARIDVIEVYFYPAYNGQLPRVKRIHQIKNAFTAIIE